MRQIQHDAAHEAWAHYQSAAERLHEAGVPGDIFSVQAELLQFDLLGASHYWQQLANVALKTQTEIANCASTLLDPLHNTGLKSTLDFYRWSRRAPPQLRTAVCGRVWKNAIASCSAFSK